MCNTLLLIIEMRVTLVRETPLIPIHKEAIDDRPDKPGSVRFLVLLRKSLAFFSPAHYYRLFHRYLFVFIEMIVRFMRVWQDTSALDFFEESHKPWPINSARGVVPILNIIRWVNGDKFLRLGTNFWIKIQIE